MSHPTATAGANEAGEAPDLQILADEMKQAIDLASAPVAVFMLAPDADMAPFAGWKAVERHRYCQALMKARDGARVILEADELACPAAAKAFGFKPLPPALQTGKGLVGFPGARLGQLVDSLAFLTEKAVPRSRAKRAHQALVSGRAAADEPSPFQQEDDK